MIFCTIISSDYLPWALTLNDSLRSNGYFQKLHVLVADEGNVKVNENLEIIRLSDIYTQEYPDVFQLGAQELRWATKPILIKYLIKKHPQICYMDCDIFVTNNIDIIIEELGSSKALLTPHYRSRNPRKDAEEFKFNYKHGLFNAGFIAFNKSGEEILDWWASCCNYRCEKNLNEGLWDDQRYLDAIPVFFEGVKICKHPGFNVAFWNKNELIRSIENGQTLLNGKELVFIHFAYTTWNEINNGEDGIDPKYANEFNHLLIKNGWKSDLNTKYLERITKKEPSGIFVRLKNKTRWVLYRR